MEYFRQENIQLLKDRLMFALGLKTLGPQAPQHKSTGYFQTQQPHQVCPRGPSIVKLSLHICNSNI